MWNLSNSNPTEIKLQATVWHKLFIYIALFLVVLVLIIVLIMEHRRKNVISWKRAAHMRKLEMMLLCIPIIILGYMGYEYYVGTHVTAASLDKVAEQQQEELLENRKKTSACKMPMPVSSAAAKWQRPASAARPMTFPMNCAI